MHQWNYPLNRENFMRSTDAESTKPIVHDSIRRFLEALLRVCFECDGARPADQSTGPFATGWVCSDCQA